MLGLLAVLSVEVGLATSGLPGGAPGGPSSSVAAAPSGTAGTIPPSGTARPSPAPTQGAPGVDDATLARLVGQKLMVAMAGTSPGADLLGRVRRGEVGGVILFGFNIASAPQVRALTTALQAAAAAGGQPPLLISTDQEGGLVKRIPWAPPTRTPPEMGADGRASIAEAEGRATGEVLRCAGINMDLAPVADVPASNASFMLQRGRTWSFDAGVTATVSTAFASGLMAGGTVPAMKHFPGLGFATENTDDHAVTITASAGQLAPELLPYQAAIARDIPVVMLSNATYTAYDPANAAGWSRAIAVDLLRGTLGFGGVTITDSLSGTAQAQGVSAVSLARRAARAGADMILLTGSEAATRRAFDRLMDDARAGTLPLAELQASYDRIVALKATLAAPTSDVTPPTVAAPASRLYAPSTLDGSRIPVRTRWSATDPCAVAGYALERRLDADPWQDRSLPRPTAASLKETLPRDSVVRYRVVATDGAGNESGASRAARLVPILRQATAARVQLTGSWRRADGGSFSGGATWYATAAGASASYTFTGTSVGWVAAVGPGRGAAEVRVDGVLEATVDLRASSTERRRVVFAKSWDDEGEHTIEIVVLGTPGHPRVDVDAFAVLTSP